MPDSSAMPGQKFDNGKLIFYAMILSSLAISVVSAYETYLGLLDFMGTGAVGKLFAGILTFGIQVLLFAISWSLANHLKDGFRANLPRWTIWILCAFFSGYFSYYGFFQTTGGVKDDKRMVAVNRESSDIYISIEEQLALKLDDAHVDLFEGDGQANFETWKSDNLEAVIAVATDNDVGDLIAEAARQSRVALTNDIQDLRDQLVPLRTEQARLGNRTQRGGDSLSAMRSRRSELQSRLGTLAGERDDTQAELSALETQLERELLTGEGPNARALRLEVNTAEANLEGLSRQLETSRAALEQLEDELAEAEAIADAGIEEQRLNDLAASIAAIESEISQAELGLATASQEADFDFRTVSRYYDARILDLLNKDYTALDQLVEQCSTLKQQLTDAGLGTEVSEVACSNTAMSQGVTQLAAQQSKFQDYTQQCMQERPDPIRPDTLGAPLQITPMLDHLDDCVEFIEDARERDDFKERVGTLNTQRGDNVEPITEASVALFIDRQGNSIMSLIFAVIVDVLVLLCALVGLNVGLPERARAIDLLLGRARAPKDAGPNVEKQINLASMEPNRRSMMDPVISDLLRQGLAEFSDDEGTKLNLLRGATRRLTQMRRQEVSDAADKLDAGGRDMRTGQPRQRPSRSRD